MENQEGWFEGGIGCLVHADITLKHPSQYHTEKKNTLSKRYQLIRQEANSFLCAEPEQPGSK